MKAMRVSLLVGVVSLFCCLCVQAQQSAMSQAPSAPASATVVPNLVRFSGVLKDDMGRPLTGVVGVTFALYERQEGGAALWIETQNVKADANGNYTVLLGSTRSDGVSPGLFAGGQARWLGVQPERQPEMTRVLLASVPYAMKARDAQTLGGLPASAFLQAQGTGAGSAVLMSAGTSAAATSTAVPITISVTTGGLASGTVPVADGPSDLKNSEIKDNGTNVSLGSCTPGAAFKLDVCGAANVRGVLQLPATGVAVSGATGGKNSQPFDLFGSTFNSSLATAISQHFRLQEEPVGQSTPTPSGKVSLLYAPGTAAPAETGFSINSKGIATFATGQKFPGTGTITGVTAGTDLTGGGTTGKVTLNLNLAATDARYARLGAANSFTGNQSITGNLTDTGNLNATGSVSGASASFTGTVSGNTGSFSGNVSGANLSTGGNVSGATGTFTGEVSANEFFADTTSSEAVAGISTVSNGVYGESDNDAGFQAATYGWEFGSTTENLGLWGFSASSIGAGVYGESVSSSTLGSGFTPNAGIWGDTGNPNNDGVLGTADDAFPLVGFNNSSSRTTLFVQNETTGSSTAPVLRTVGSGFGGACTIDVSGNLGCTGTKTAVVPVNNGTRKVALYAVEAPENWFEDFGSGVLAGGVATIALEPTFAQTVNTAMEYHVFLTPEGDCKGLYITNKTASGFEVHELGGGRSNVPFDYRIVARRKGYENVRLADKTKEYPNPGSVRKAMPTKPPIPTKRARPALGKPAPVKIQSVATHK